MKIIKIISISLGVVITSYLTLSCAKTSPEKLAAVNTDFNNKAVVQVFVATVNATRNYVYVDANPVTGALLSSGSVFPSQGNGFNVNGGVRAFLVADTQVNKTPVTTQVPLSFAENLTAGKHFTVFIYDTITTPKQLIVQDNIYKPADTGSCRLRFANFIYNPSAVPNVDVYSFKTGTNIFTNIPVTGVTDYISYPSKVPLDTLYVRETGTSNLLLKVSMSVLTPFRNYTFVYRGSHRSTTKSSSLFANY